MNLTFESLQDGMEFSAHIDGTPCEGKLCMYDNHVFLCQDKKDGIDCRRDRRHGYQFSWIIKDPYKKTTTLDQALKIHGVNGFKILNKRKDRITDFYNQN